MTNIGELARYLLFLFKEQMKNIADEEFDVTPMKLQKLHMKHIMVESMKKLMLLVSMKNI